MNKTPKLEMVAVHFPEGCFTFELATDSIFPQLEPGQTVRVYRANDSQVSIHSNVGPYVGEAVRMRSGADGNLVDVWINSPR